LISFLYSSTQVSAKANPTKLNQMTNKIKSNFGRHTTQQEDGPYNIHD